MQLFNFYYNLSIRTKLYLALFSTALLVSLSLLLFLGYSAYSFDVYLKEIDSGLLKRIALKVERQYAASDEDWSFLQPDLETWARESRPNFKQTNQQNVIAPSYRQTEQNIAPEQYRRRNGGFGFQSFESRLQLLGPDGQLVAGIPHTTLAQDSVALYHNGLLIGTLELAPYRSGQSFPGRFSFSDGTAASSDESTDPTEADDYTSNLINRSQFMTLQIRVFVALGLTTVTVLLLLGFPLARYFTRRIETLNGAATSLTQGELSTRVTVKGKDELGRLAIAFNYLAEVLQKNKTSQQEWVSNISHELRTPLGLLKGELEAIQDGIRKADPEEINLLYGEVEQLSRLVNDLFELSRSDLGGLNYYIEDIDLIPVLEDAVARFREQLQANQLTLEAVFQNMPECNISGDSQRLLQLFSNIIQNSILYTDPGGTLRITVECSKELISLNFSDSSPGVPSVELTRLFDRFYRMEQSRNRSTGGAGLGLAICQSITQAHQGTIKATPSDLGGISINITFPRIS